LELGAVGTEAYVVESATTALVPPQQRADFWSDLVSSYHSTMTYDFPSRDDFNSHVLRQRSATYQLVSWQSDEYSVCRTERDIRRHSDGDYRLLFPTTGHVSFAHDGQKFELLPGVALLISLDEPFALWQSAATRASVLTIPRMEVDGRLHRSAPGIDRLDLTSGLGRVIRGLATNLFEEYETLTCTQFDAVSDRLVELMCMLVLGDNRPVVTGHLADVEAAVRRHIRAHLDDPHLTGSTVAKALGWSLRQIQLALQQAGTTPRELIREERLKLARDHLQSPAYRNWTISDIASKLAFSSTSAFSTAFRERFGVRPSDIRRPA
jgi:AraC-like DNA-binding protein